MNIIEGISGFTWGQIVYKPQSVFGPRIQRNYQLVLVHEGGLEIEIDGEGFPVGAGEVVLLRPGQVETFRFSEHQQTHHSWVHAERIPAKDPWSPVRAGPVRKITLSERMSFLIGQLVGEKDPRDRVEHTLLNRMAEAAFLEFFHLAGFVFEEPVPHHPAVERSIDIIKTRYRKALSLEELAREAGLSPQHLSRLFRAETGLTPIRFLWRIREEEGVRLLRETGLTVSQIAEGCGFQNPFHFTRRIRQRYGEPPRSVRQRYWKGE